MRLVAALKSQPPDRGGCLDRSPEANHSCCGARRNAVRVAFGLRHLRGADGTHHRIEDWVELNEAFRRIVLQHVRLIACFVITGLAVGALVHRATGKTFTTSARLALDTQDPASRTEAAAIADMGQAIATSPAQIRAALN